MISLNTFVDTEKGVTDLQEALAGARDIIAEWVSENQVVTQKCSRTVLE